MIDLVSVLTFIVLAIKERKAGERFILQNLHAFSAACFVARRFGDGEKLPNLVFFNRQRQNNTTEKLKD